MPKNFDFLTRRSLEKLEKSLKIKDKNHKKLLKIVQQYGIMLQKRTACAVL
jgi:hypothetical protein